MLRIEVTPGRFYLDFDYQETSDGQITGSQLVGGQRGHFTYRNAEHFIEVRRGLFDETTTFTADEVARMERDGRYFDNRKDFEQHLRQRAEDARLFEKHVAQMRDVIRSRPVPLPPRSLRRLDPDYALWSDEYWTAVVAAVEPDLAAQSEAWKMRCGQ